MRVNVLWTGGWDSTFRVVELSQKEVEIQPYYVIDKGRGSRAIEMEAIGKITESLKANPKTKATFLPVIFTEIEEIQKNDEITETWKRMHEKYMLGSQYDWLARLALSVNGLEIGIEKPDTPNERAATFMNKCGALKKVSEGEVETYAVDQEKSSKEFNILFGNMTFPIIYKTKRDMKRIAEEEGYMNVMNMTWFCFTPKNGKPCGLCNPCKIAIEEGMTFRFTKAALTRYKFRKVYALRGALSRFTPKRLKAFLKKK